MLSLVLGTVLVLALSGWFLLLAPSVDSVARARISQLSALVEGQLDRLGQNSQRVLRIAANWLSNGNLALDHQSLNHRFMPLLAQYPEYSAMMIADGRGSEWMLYKQPEGGWLNRLSAPSDREDRHRFIEWDADSKQIVDEPRDSDYRTTERPWFKAAHKVTPGGPAWTEIYRFHTSGEPGVSASMRIPLSGSKPELTLGLDLQLIDIAHYLNSMRIGQQGLAILLTSEGKLLGLSNRGDEASSTLEEMIFKPVLGLELGPLKAGVDLWLDRDAEGMRDTLLVYDKELWHVGFRRLDLGDQDLWLGVYMPISELIPGLYRQIAGGALLILLALFAAVYLARRRARNLSEPLEHLAANSLRIGDLDFSVRSPSRVGILEIDRLGGAQDEMRNLLASSHEALKHKNQELAAAQDRLVQAAKLESVGRLAAGVAHEVKNPLAIIQMGVDFLRGEPDNTPESLEVLKDMDDAVIRADQVIKGLLDFSREHKLKLTEGSINEVIRASLHLVEHELRQRHIQTELRLSEPLPNIPRDAPRLKQVFINLFMNAAQAMGRDGTLHISADQRRLTDHSGLERIDHRCFETDDPVLWVEVADTGPGIDADKLQNIFDPFFTTKAVGQGTGLGLSVSRKIVQLHGGCLDIRNQAGGGASAVLVFKLSGVPDD